MHFWIIRNMKNLTTFAKFLENLDSFWLSRREAFPKLAFITPYFLNKFKTDKDRHFKLGTFNLYKLIRSFGLCGLFSQSRSILRPFLQNQSYYQICFVWTFFILVYNTTIKIYSNMVCVMDVKWFEKICISIIEWTPKHMIDEQGPPRNQ